MTTVLCYSEGLQLFDPVSLVCTLLCFLVVACLESARSESCIVCRIPHIQRQHVIMSSFKYVMK